MMLNERASPRTIAGAASKATRGTAVQYVQFTMALNSDSTSISRVPALGHGSSSAVLKGRASAIPPISTRTPWDTSRMRVLLLPMPARCRCTAACACATEHRTAAPTACCELLWTEPTGPSPGAPGAATHSQQERSWNVLGTFWERTWSPPEPWIWTLQARGSERMQQTSLPFCTAAPCAKLMLLCVPT